jgi:hypothetical protein
MEYKNALIDKIKAIIGKSQNQNDIDSANTLLKELYNNKSGASLLSDALKKHKGKEEKSKKLFSEEYIDFIKNYDIGKLIEEGVDFGETLTILADIDHLKSHQVQFREGVDSDDFGGLDRTRRYENITILMHYPSDAKLIEYISQRFTDEFRNAKVMFSPK